METVACNRCQKPLPPSEGHVSVYREGELLETICCVCSREEVVSNYLKSQEISTSVWSAASSCRYYAQEVPEGFSRLREEYREYYTRHKDTLIKIANDMDEVCSVMKAFENEVWLPRLKRYYSEADDRGHEGDGGNYKAMLWGCAGRVLLTLEDKEPDGPFGGAWITFIFDETSEEARGGVQGLCATKSEALSLIAAARAKFPDMAPAPEVKMAGL